MKKILLINLIALLIFGCGKKELLPSDLVKWVKTPENGLIQTKQIDDLEISVLYKPVEYVISNEIQSNNIPHQAYSEREKELKDMQYYECRLSVKGVATQNIINYKAETEEEFYKRKYYFSFGFQNDIKLIEGPDTLKCNLFHFERAYNLAPHRTFLLGFEKSNKTNNDNDKTLLINSEALYTGPLEFKFNTEDISNVPQLKLL